MRPGAKNAGRIYWVKWVQRRILESRALISRIQVRVVPQHGYGRAGIFPGASRNGCMQAIIHPQALRGSLRRAVRPGGSNPMRMRRQERQSPHGQAPLFLSASLTLTRADTEIGAPVLSADCTHYGMRPFGIDEKLDPWRARA